MSTITIHAEDYLAVAVRDYADRAGKSVNMAVKDLLASALDLVKPTKRKTPSFMKCHGILDHGAAEELRAAQADFSKVEPELWR